MNGETMIGVPLSILSGSILLASSPTMVVTGILALIFLIVGVSAVVDDLVLEEKVLKAIMRAIFKNSAQLR